MPRKKEKETPDQAQAKTLVYITADSARRLQEWTPTSFRTVKAIRQLFDKRGIRYTEKKPVILPGGDDVIPMQVLTGLRLARGQEPHEHWEAILLWERTEP